MRSLLILIVGLAALARIPAAERVIDFGDTPVDRTPKGFRSTVSGEGTPGDWRVVLEEVPPLMVPMTSRTRAMTRRPVLAQLARSALDEHFPLLVYEDEVFTDFQLTTQFKTVDGKVEQMAGVAFRIQDEKNYYVVRASSLGNTFRFYKFVDGQRGPPIGKDIEIPKGIWHKLTIDCKGNRIRLLLNDQEPIPVLTDNSFTAGKIGFWTKSDSVSQFGQTRIVYTPKETLAQSMVRELMAKYPRLVAIRIFVPSRDGAQLTLAASSASGETGRLGSEDERQVIAKGEPHVAKGKGIVSAILPLRDRNGEVIAAVRVTMNSMLGQTEQNAFIRAKPIVDDMQKRTRSLQDLTE